MAGELATRDQATGGAIASQATRAVLTRAALDEESQQRELLGEYVQRHMVEGVDFGVIPGTKNKTLLKPGAEKLTQLFRCLPRFTIEEKIENWDTGLFYYRFSCQIVTLADGDVVAEGVGSCSTYESRYRWRQADLKCPECGAAAIKRSKFPPKDRPEEKPGFYCFGKVGGCGANFAADDQRITGQPVGRQQNPDLHDCANTVLKMAKKRSLVDASIALARCSDIFTQDAEDFVDAEVVPPQQPAKPQPAAGGPSLPPDRYAALAEGLAAAADLPALAAAWKAVVDTRGKSEGQLKALETIKDRRKAELTPAQQPKPAAAEPPAAADPDLFDLLRDLDDEADPEEVDADLRQLGYTRDMLPRLVPMQKSAVVERWKRWLAKLRAPAAQPAGSAA